MREFHSLSLENYPLFEKESFDLVTPGISVVLGLNLNGTKTKAAGARQNTNAVGKSLFFSALKDIAFRAGSSGNVKDKPKRGKSTLRLKVGNNAYEIQRYLSGKSEKFKIVKNGEDCTPKNAADQRERIEKILGRDEDTFALVDYLESGANPIRTGDTGFRRTFFTKFFNLTQADRIKKLVEAEVDRFRMDGARLKELSAQMEASATDAPSIKALREELAVIGKRSEAAQSRLQSMRDARDYHSFLLKHHAALQVCQDAQDRYDPRHVHEDLTREAKAMRKVLRRLSAHQDYQQDLRAYKKALAKRDAYLEEHGVSAEDLDALKKNKAKLQSELDQLDAQTSDFKDKRAIYQHRISVGEGQLEDLSTTLSKLAKNKNCSKCGQPVTNEHYAQEKKDLEGQITATKNSLTKIQAKLDETDQTLKHLTKKRTAKEAALAEIEERRQVYNRIPQVPEKPTKPEALSEDESASAEDVEKSLRKVEDKLSRIEDLVVLLNAVDGNHPALHRWLRNEDSVFDEEKYDSLSEKVIQLTQACSKLEQQIENAKEQREQRKRLQTRIEELSINLEDLDAVKVLEKAFASNSGVKQIQINAACEELEAQVNTLAAQLFPEPFTFEFDLSSQFQILVTRRVGKSEETTDVRKLSGMEAALFDMTMALALRSFLPVNLRSNIIILDEMDAKFGPAAQDQFIRFLPVLAKTIPHVIIITPKMGVNYGDAVRYFTVVKNGLTSRVVPGRHVSSDTLPKDLFKASARKRKKEEEAA